MKEVVAYCRVACAKESDPSAEVQRQEQMIRRYADARGLIICETYLGRRLRLCTCRTAASETGWSDKVALY
jgi:hypothetical protein